MTQPLRPPFCPPSPAGITLHSANALNTGPKGRFLPDAETAGALHRRAEGVVDACRPLVFAALPFANIG